MEISDYFQAPRNIFYFIGLSVDFIKFQIFNPTSSQAIPLSPYFSDILIFPHKKILNISKIPLYSFSYSSLPSTSTFHFLRILSIPHSSMPLTQTHSLTLTLLCFGLRSVDGCFSISRVGREKIHSFACFSF